MKLAINFSMPPTRDEPAAKKPSLKWEKCNASQKQAYGHRLAHGLSKTPSLLTQCGSCHCKELHCRKSIQTEYDSIVHQLKEADKTLPRHKPGVQKNWWSEELNLLKNQNIEIHRLWKTEGKPHSGATNTERLRVKATYRKALRAAQKAPKQSCWNRLHEAFTAKNTDQFWKSWKKQYSVNKSHLHPVVNGLSAKQDISDSFRDHFVLVSKPNNISRVEKIDCMFKEKYAETQASHAQSCKCKEHNISLDAVLDATFSMKKGKTCDDESITAEHFFYGPLQLFDRLQQLFNAMLRHSFVPLQFQLGTIIPLVKDHQGNLGDMNNYRGITISPIVSKIFEHVLKIVFISYFASSKYQFGFKRKSSTSHAVYCLKEAINYYTSRGSNVYCSFLDASKAFDRVVHSGLFLKLLQRDIPLIFLDLIIYWYSSLSCRVRWDDSHSDWFSISAGVRQGGVLSPDFYCLYIDDLALILVRLRIGFHRRDLFLSVLLYADDMALALAL